MSIAITVVSLITVLLHHLSDAWPDGAPCIHSAFESMNPLEAVEHQGGLQLTNPPYTIDVLQKCYWKNQPIEVTLRGNSSSDRFRGFAMQPIVYRGPDQGKRMGNFLRLDDNGSWQQQCFRFKDSATHSHEEKKKRMKLWWQNDINEEDVIQFVATAVKAQKTFWVKSVLSVPIPPCQMYKDGITGYVPPAMHVPPPSSVMLHFTLLVIFGAVCDAALKLNDENSVTRDYAEVRHLLNQYYKLIGSQYGMAHDYDANRVNNGLKNTHFDDGTEASTNRKQGVAGDLFENDILLTLPQVHSLLKDVGKRGPRQAQIGLQYYWPREPISFVLRYNDQNWQNLIREALRYVQRETCIRFQENRSARDQLQFIRGSGCWSNVGRIGGRQQVSIGYGCDGIGVVAHETLHALGLWHEQSRTDRDQYISINRQNIFQGTQGNFEKRSDRNTDNMGQPYDLGSVMHYGSKAFAIDYSRDTIRTLDPNFQQTIGQRDQMSFKDIKMINMRYCGAVCSQKLPCYNGGYTDPNRCDRCKCPQGYGGIYCNDVEPSVPSSCGGSLSATNTFTELSNPPLASNMRCVWRITSPEKVQVVVDQLSLPCAETCYSYVELKPRIDRTPTGSRLCCKAPAVSFISEGDDFIVIFNTQKNFDTRYGGFRLRYKSYGWIAPKATPVTVRPTTSNPRTYATSTPRPTTTDSSRRLMGVWSEWAGWSGCTSSCGGCGVRRRIRGCYSPDDGCQGPTTMEEPCGLEPCPTTSNTASCRGVIKLPCDLMEKLKFGNIPQSSATFNSAEAALFPHEESDVGNNRVSQNYATAQNGRSTSVCERPFTFPCTPYLLSINMAWKRPGEVIRDTNGCCPGYYVSDGLCKKVP